MNFSFKGGAENIYGEYLYTTYGRIRRFRWIPVLTLIIFLWIFSLYIVTHPQLFSGEAYTNPLNDTPWTPSRQIRGSIGVPISWAFAVIFPLFSACAVMIMFGKNRVWLSSNAFFARFVKAGFHFKHDLQRDFYFGKFKKLASGASFLENEIHVSAGRKNRQVAYCSIYKAFIEKRYMVLRTKWNDMPWDFMIDLSELPSGQKAAFIESVDEKLPMSCLRYYRKMSIKERRASKNSYDYWENHKRWKIEGKIKRSYDE